MPQTKIQSTPEQSKEIYQTKPEFKSRNIAANFGCSWLRGLNGIFFKEGLSASLTRLGFGVAFLALFPFPFFLPCPFFWLIFSTLLATMVAKERVRSTTTDKNKLRFGEFVHPKSQVQTFQS